MILQKIVAGARAFPSLYFRKGHGYEIGLSLIVKTAKI